MDAVQIVKAYFHALDSKDLQAVEPFLDNNYRLIGLIEHPMDKDAMLAMIQAFKAAFTNFNHSLNNLREEEKIVKVTVQISGISSAALDLRHMGYGVIQHTKKFVIFPNATYEFTLTDGKILIERDVSPSSPNRRLPGMLRALGVNPAIAL